MANTQDAAERCVHDPTVFCLSATAPVLDVSVGDDGHGREPTGRAPALGRRVPGVSPRLTLCAWALTLAGCGHAVFAMEVRSASMRVEEAREVGAPELAPYEYHYAEAHLEKAKQEAAEADFGDAIELASTAAEYAEKAIELSESAREGAGQ